MTLVLFVTLAGAIVALVEIVIFTRWRESGRISEGAYPFLVISSAILPVALYAIFTWLVPDLGSMELFT